MTYKLEINYLNIDNYPWVEKHLARRASQGWLLERVWSGSVFIYRRIGPQALEFSILPYEMETALSRVRDQDLVEMKEASQQIGWTYLTKSSDLHIYYKPEGQASQELLTDEVEEFTNLKKIGRKYLRGQYLLLALFLLLSFFSWGNSSHGVQGMKSGAGQLVALMLPLGICLNLVHMVRLRKFLKRNQGRLELGQGLCFNQGAGPGYWLIFFALAFLCLSFVAYYIYTGLILKNSLIRISLLPGFFGLVLGFLYRFFVKPSRLSSRRKKGLLALTLIFTSALAGYLGLGLVRDLNQGSLGARDEHLRVLHWADQAAEEEVLLRDTSLLFPQSYDYRVEGPEGALITEYARGISQVQAQRLVGAYLAQAQAGLRGSYSQDLEVFLDQGVYDERLDQAGLGQPVMEELRAGSRQEAEAQFFRSLFERSIQDARDLWPVDQAFFLAPNQDRLVIRQGREVFYLEGLDFSKEENIARAWVQLGLD